MKNALKLIASSSVGVGLFVVAAAYGQMPGTGTSGTPSGVLGPCPAPSTSPSPSASPSPGASAAPRQCITVSIPQNAAGMGKSAYGTNPLVIPPGTSVTWVNNDSMSHTATSDTPGVFDSGTLTTGQTYSFTFNDAGTYAYHCAIHGAASMSGTIQVQAASPSPSPSTSSSPSSAPTGGSGPYSY